MIARPVSILEWVSHQMGSTHTQSSEPYILTELGKKRVAQALDSSGENGAPVGEQKEIRKKEKIIFYLENGVEHLLVLETQARLSGLPIGPETLLLRGPGGSSFVVVDRARLGRREKPAPITKGGTDAALLSAQISTLNLEFIA